MNYKKFMVVLLAFASMQVSAQDMVHYKQVIKELSSAKYQGRGYAKGGANKAGMFLKREYEKAGVDEVTLQPFKLDINTFSGKMDVTVILNSQLAQFAIPKSFALAWISQCVSILLAFMVSSPFIM